MMNNNSLAFMKVLQSYGRVQQRQEGTNICKKYYFYINFQYPSVLPFSGEFASSQPRDDIDAAIASLYKTFAAALFNEIDWMEKNEQL